MSVVIDDFATLLKQLTEPRAFPAAVSVLEPITLVQTHLSAVVLTPQYVYKVKKPKQFEFCDYSTPALRHFFCQQEVCLNSPLAPGIYLGIAPVVSLPTEQICFGPTRPSDRIPLPGDSFAGGTVIDFSVVMQRLPETATLESNIQTNTVDAPSLVALARFVAAFHDAASTDEQIAHLGSLDVIRANWEENFRQMRPFIGRVLDSTAYEQIARFVHTFLAQRSALFENRVQHGRIRDCHGDLRLQHVYLLDNSQPPTFALLDRIEFNERFRYSDVAAEIAFLTMEMEAADVQTWHASLHTHMLMPPATRPCKNCYHFINVTALAYAAKSRLSCWTKRRSPPNSD